MSKIFNIIIQNGGGNNNLEYIDLSQVGNDNENVGFILIYSALIKYTFVADSIDGLQTNINTFSFVNSLQISIEEIKAMAIDLNLRIYNYITGYYTIKEFFEATGIYEFYSNLPRLTKEEFYNL